MVTNFIFKDIHVKVFEAEKTDKVLIAIHGFAGDCESSVITAIAKELLGLNITTVTFDLPTHGESPLNDVLNLNNCISHLNTIETYVKENFRDTPISYFATSFGGYLLLNKLSNSNEIYDKLILRAPAIFMGDILGDTFKVENRAVKDKLKEGVVNFGYTRDLIVDYDFYKDLKNYDLSQYSNKNHLYVIQGKKDDIVDYKRNENWFKLHAQNNHTIYYFEEADHRFKKPGELEEIVMITKNLIKTCK